MIICSSCHSENPIHHRYCQQCGDPLPKVSLSEDSLPKEFLMDEEYSLDRGNNSHQFTQDEMAAIASTHQSTTPSDGWDKSIEVDVDIEYRPENTRLAIVPTLPLWLQAQHLQSVYLDQHQRYQLLSPLPETEALATVPANGFEFILLDRYAETLPDGLAEDDVISHSLDVDAMNPANAPYPSDSSDSKVATTDSAPVKASPARTQEVTASELAATELQEIETTATSSSTADGEQLEMPSNPSLASMAKPDTTDSAPLLDLDNGENSAVKTHPAHPEPLPHHDQVHDSEKVTSLDAVDAVSPNQDIIQIYLTLQDQLYPSFPPVLDQLDNIIILENRDLLTPLQDAIAQADVVVPQILHWFHEMTELWELLTEYHCSDSLLTLNNIRVDEDQILCLRRLYLDSGIKQHSLSHLGELWHRLHQCSVASWPDALVQIYQDLKTCVIADTDTLRHRLEFVADKIYQETVAIAAASPLLNASLVDEWDSSSDVTPVDVNVLANKLRNADADTLSNPLMPSHDRSLGTAESIAELPTGAQISLTETGRSHLGDDPTVVLPMQLHTLSHVGSTNNGIQRDHNEDFFAIETQVSNVETPADRVCCAKGLYILCDGMGGHSAGEVASALAGETLQAYFKEHWTEQLPDELTIHDGIVLANQVLFERNQADNSEGFRRMGTTLVMMLIQDTKVAIAHVGDSRIYRFTRRQGLEQLTVDHEVGQREIARGVDPSVAYARPDAQQLTQALGPRDRDFIRPDIKFWEMNEDSLFILGSDGLTDNNLLETYCHSHIEPFISGNANLDEGAYNLIDLANQVNGHDNITVVLVRVKLRPKLSVLGR